MVSRAIYILKIATAVGTDLWSPADLRKLPNKALRELAEILQVVEANATWPSHLLYCIIVLIGKHQRGGQTNCADAHVISDLDAENPIYKNGKELMLDHGMQQ
eukprot:9590757-Karenia_brevis.AAC.1